MLLSACPNLSSLSFIALCTPLADMSSVLWAASRLEVVPQARSARQRSVKLTGSLATSRRSYHPSLVKSRLSLGQNAYKRSYSTPSRGEALAQEFEAWIESIPLQQSRVRPSPSPLSLHSPFIRSSPPLPIQITLQYCP